MSSYKFDEDFLNSAYQCARPFAEGEIYKSVAYDEAYISQLVIYCDIIDEYGKDIAPLLEKLGYAFSEEIILRAMHYFREGYLLCLKEHFSGEVDEH